MLWEKKEQSHGYRVRLIFIFSLENSLYLKLLFWDSHTFVSFRAKSRFNESVSILSHFCAPARFAVVQVYDLVFLQLKHMWVLGIWATFIA